MLQLIFLLLAGILGVVVIIAIFAGLLTLLSLIPAWAWIAGCFLFVTVGVIKVIAGD